MVLYYDNNEIYLDFQTIRERVSLNKTALYRRLRRVKGIKYRNRNLFKYSDLIELPEIFKEIQENEFH
jgi:hypothetical protein